MISVKAAAVTDQCEPSRTSLDTIAGVITAWAKRTPNAIAVRAPERAPLTYGQLGRELARVNAMLNTLAVQRNERIALVLPNGPEMAVAFLGVAASATAAPLNPGYRAEEFDFYLSDLNARALLLPAEMDSPAREVARARGIQLIEVAPLSQQSAGMFENSVVPSTGLAEPMFAQAEDIALVLHTSGTTARPKIVPLTHANICASARHISAWLHLTPDDCCLNVMPLFHIHGLVGALLASLAAGASVICPPGFYAPQFFGWLDRLGATWYTAVPTIHRAILDRAAANSAVSATHPLRFIRSSSAALSPQLMAEMERVWHAPVIESYGMTEAAHQMASNPLPPLARKPGSVGMAAGPQIAIMNEAGRLLDAGEKGEIVIRGSNVMMGYENNATANASCFTNGWFRTGDEGYLDAEGYLFITGRLKELINRGGAKIAPREIDEVLLSHPAVAQAVTFAMPDPRLGEEVAAAVVLRENMNVTERELRDYAAQQLADFKVPRRLVLLQEIPKGPTGKLQRIGLAEKLGLNESAPATAAPRSEFVAPRGELEAQVANIWRNVLGVESVGIHDNFSEIGGDSLLAAQLLARVRAELHADLPFLTMFEESATIATMSALIEQMRREARGPVVPSALVREPDTLRDAAQDERGQLLSNGQQRLWFLDQFEPNSSIYNMHRLNWLKGALQVDALEQSLNEILERHQVLRATFRMTRAEPRQFITPLQPFALPRIDLRQLPAQERVAAAEQLALQAAVQPYDLARGPLFRALLIQLADDEYALLLAMHHIVSDGWSLGVLSDELSALYNAYRLGNPSPLPELPIQYADYTLRQCARLQGKTAETQLDYWRKQLAGAPPVLELPPDRPRPRIRTNHGAIESVMLEKALVDLLAQLGHREHVTFFMVLLAAFQSLLRRYSGQEDVIVGVPIAGRRDIDSEKLIGFFLNTLVMRTDLSGDPTFRELLARVRAVALNAYSHQDVPFEQLVAELRPDRNLSWTPIFQVIMQFETFSKASLKFAGIEIADSQLDLGISRFDLALTLSDKSEGVLAKLQYNTDLFEPATIARMLGHFKSLLAGVVKNPDEHISHLPLLTEAERHLQLVEWNATAAPFSDDKCIHQLFEEQVARTPDAIALVAGQLQLTYRELNRRVNQFAHYLQRLGVTPDTLIGISLERSVEQIVALLGILKAGGAYLPLDSTYPRERLAFMLEEAGPPLLVSRGQLPRDLYNGAQVIDLEREADEIARESMENPTSAVRPHNLAYVIYTSGSTGQPKGVQIEHRGLCNSAIAQQQTFGLNPGAHMLQFASLNFDASIFEIVMALTAGAALYLTPREAQFSGSDLYHFLHEQSIEAAILTPSTLAALPDAPLPKLKTLMVGGEALPAALVMRWANGRRMFNLYGPTEGTIWATVARCAPGIDKPPLGRPIANVRTYILDAHLQPVPVGAAGELHIGGAGLSRGYLNREELTLEKFIPDPFSEEPNSRLYKTGDLARYLPDGNIEYLGRLDRQIKLRGFRIELGEIENVLRQHPTVQDVVVTMRDDVGTPGTARLVAYIVPRPGEEVHSAELQAHAKTRLPDHMVPSAFVRLEALPTTPSDKVDARGLPAPATVRPESAQTYVPPETELECALAQLWEEMLGVERVGRHDDFFELGGDSILAAILTNQLQERLEEHVSVVLIFEAPSIAELAAALTRQYPSAIVRLTARSTVLSTETNPEPSKAMGSVERILTEINELSEGELDALLSALLDDTEPKR